MMHHRVTALYSCTRNGEKNKKKEEHPKYMPHFLANGANEAICCMEFDLSVTYL
jgi:hypothetical protein